MIFFDLLTIFHPLTDIPSKYPHPIPESPYVSWWIIDVAFLAPKIEINKFGIAIFFLKHNIEGSNVTVNKAKLLHVVKFLDNGQGL